MISKIQVLNTLITASGNEKAVENIIQTWERLIAVTLGEEVTKIPLSKDSHMFEEYDKIRNLRPQLKIEKNTHGEVIQVGVKGLTPYFEVQKSLIR